jgi:hypothetical protein
MAEPISAIEIIHRDAVQGSTSVIEDDKAAHFKQSLWEELETAGHGGVRITPENVVSAVELIKHDEAQSFLNGFGYLCLRAPETE